MKYTSEDLRYLEDFSAHEVRLQPSGNFENADVSEMLNSGFYRGSLAGMESSELKNKLKKKKKEELHNVMNVFCLIYWIGWLRSSKV